jgi:hypothetical protein
MRIPAIAAAEQNLFSGPEDLKGIRARVAEVYIAHCRVRTLTYTPIESRANILKRGKCKCNRWLFFGNTACLGCDRSVGRCCACRAMASFSPASTSELFSCDNCHAEVQPCANRNLGICNCFANQTDSTGNVLCTYCEFTRVVPPHDSPDKFSRWRELESAKRRLLIQLSGLEFPPFASKFVPTCPLVFEFKEDTVLPDGSIEAVFTGHENGVITINAHEADSVRREQSRVAFNEPQRTLIGHMRHEYGHFLDLCCIQGDLLRAKYVELFGDPATVDYAEAKTRYYAQGPTGNWPESYVSAYASMHPWEDFAETVNVYLDLMALAETARDQLGSNIDTSANGCVATFISELLDLAITVSEFNFDMGLNALLPERFNDEVVCKLSYVHSLR